MTGLGANEEYYILLDDDQQVPMQSRGKLVKAGADGAVVELGNVELK